MSKTKTIADLEYVEAELRSLNEATEERDLSDDEWSAVAEGLAFVSEARARIAKYEALETAAAAAPVERSGDGARDFQYQRKVEDRDVPVRALSRGELRDKALATLERGADEIGLSDAQASKVEKLIRRSDGAVATRMLLTESDAYRSAFQKVVSGSVGFTAEESRALDEVREMNITTPGDGGYGVPILIDPTIILTDQGSTNPFWSIADVKTITTKDWRGVSAAGVTFAFETESAAANDLSPSLAQPIVHAHKVQGAIPYSIEVGMDYPEFASEMGRLLLFGYDEILLDKFTRGSGSGEPWGIFDACEQATSQVVVSTDGQLNAADVNAVWAALPQRFRANASWLMNVDVNNDIQALGDDKLSKQTVNLAAGGVDILKGKTVYESPYAPTFTGTTGQASILVVGDFRHFVIAQRAGMNVEPVQHLLDTTTGLPNGQRAFYAWARVGSDSVVDNAFRMLVNT